MRVVLTAAVVATIVLAGIPLTPYDGAFSPDETEYAAIGHSWASGSGFVDPVQWHFVLHPGPVAPAAAVRPPVVPLLFGVVFWFGATLPFLIELHVVWAAMVAGLITMAGARMMRLPAAAAAGLLVGASHAYIHLAPFLLTEITAVAVFLAVLATVGGIPRSIGSALLCAALSVVAWLTRPNFLGLPLAVVVALVWQLGPSAALRNRGTWTYVGSLALLIAGVRAASIALTGLAPYASHALLSTQLDPDQATSLVVTPVGTLEFLSTNASTLGAIVLDRVDSLRDLLFARPVYGYVGWIALPGALWCLFRRSGSATRRFCALSAFGLTLTVLITFAAFDPTRYPLLPAVPGALCGFAFVDDLARLLADQMKGTRARALLSMAPLVLALLLVGPRSEPRLDHLTSRWLGRPSAPTLDRIETRAQHLIDLCAYVAPDALITTKEPWKIARYCGNPALRIPHKLMQGYGPRDFVNRWAPQYVITSSEGTPPWARLRRLVRPVASSGPFTLFETRAAPSDRNTWAGPGPLRCAGQPADLCQRVTRTAE